MKNFQVIVVAIFIGFAIFGILVFSGAIKIGDQTDVAGSQGVVVLWGTVKPELMTPLIQEFNAENKTFVLQYVQKFVDTFNDDLLEALASGKGPDIFLIPDNLAYHYSNKIYTIPYTSYPVATFKNTFAGAGEVFMTSKGILAFPIAIDPLMMYYNRSILDANNIVYPPAFWDEFINLIPLMTKKDDSKQISKSAVALGQFSNVANAKDILAALFMQTGNPIVKEGSDSNWNGALVVSSNAVNRNSGLGSVLSFFTSFADPLKESYSWNRSLPYSRDYFSAENLAFYFGFSSELRTLINKNPNQNFQVASIPQIKNANFKLTSSHVTGIAISSSSKNFNTAVTAASLLATSNFAGKYAAILGIPPARRDLLSVKLNDAYSPAFYASALYAKSWIDPEKEGTDLIFKNMIDSVLSNTLTADSAVTDANDKLNLLLLK
ncbi:MAG: hypothetical protein AAB438_00435 [Patescibacteria group bacterium]